MAAGALVLVTAAISVAVIELTGNRETGLASVAADSVAVIDPHTNRIVGQIPAGSAPTRVAYGRDGLWVITQHDKTVTRIDPKTRTAVRTIPVGGTPIDVAVAENAVLLVAYDAIRGGPARIVRIDPGLNDVLRTIPLGTGPFGFGTTADGSLAVAAGTVWVVSFYPKLAVSRIDGAENKVTATFTVGGLSLGFDSGTAGGVPGASGIAIGEGSVWVASDAGITPINARSNAVSPAIRLGVAIPTALAVGEGAIWVAARPAFRCCPPEAVGTGTLTRIDPTTGSVVATIPIGGRPAGVAVGKAAIWVTDPGTRSVVRVDPKTNRVVKRIRVGARPRGIAVGGDFVWVSAS